MKWVDLPPFWLLGCLVAAWAIAQLLPGLTVEISGQGKLALVPLLSGVVLMGLAVYEMSRARTTIIPRHEPNALVTSGIFRLTRNPIYLGDWLVLLAGILWWGVWIALPLLWVFPWIIVTRFINGEEAKMRDYFGDSFDAWAAKTRRWI